MLIGLTGSYCSGKDMVAEYLVARKGFVHRSLSDELRRELEARGVDVTRENLIRIGSELRSRSGDGVLAVRALARCAADGNYVITSIRHPGEIAELQRRRGFCLVRVDAPADVRFRRMLKRKRPGDPATFEKFAELERQESQSDGPGQQLDVCSRMAALSLVNDTDRSADLYACVDRLLETLSGRMGSR